MSYSMTLKEAYDLGTNHTLFSLELFIKAGMDWEEAFKKVKEIYLNKEAMEKVMGDKL